MSEIKIVEYNETLAQKVADMWNDSADGWGGGDTIKTGDDVKRSEAGSENTNLYLAMEGDLVVGYCGLSEYRFDEDTMYIPLLNVRPSHHGKKIGKMLLLTALNRVIELGWPRLDLFTWAGNTKAVPLYKKCGFFWEEMDNSTHLMSFIPAVLTTEAIKDYFESISWYDNSTRVIEVKPDGIKENKFEYFEYSWQKDSTNLRVQFERRGRGIRLIETDDYLISATVEKLNLVFGRKYQVTYKLVNKTGKPLKIEIEGQLNKNVDNTFKATMEVKGEEEIHNYFSVGEVKEEQNDFKTHPKVAAKLKINGKEATFEVGINPEFPAKLSLKGHKELSYLNQKGTIFLDIENKFDEEATFNIEIPSSDLIELEQKKVSVNLEANGKKSIPLSYYLKKHGYFSPELKIEVTLKGEDVVKFTKKTGFPFKGLGEKFFGESEKYWELYNDKFVMAFEKLDNWQIPTRNEDDGQISAIMPPKLGKPFYDEFAKKAPEDFNYYPEGSKAVLEYVFKSDKIKNIHLRTIHKLHQNGILSTSYEVINKGEDTIDDIYLCSPILHKIGRGVIPLKEGIVELDDSIGAGYSYWESKDISENWIFSKSNSIPRGLCWPSQYEVEFRGWHVALTTNLGKIPANKMVETEPVYISVGAFDTWQEFRAFALREEVIHRPKTMGSISLEVNEGNPFIKDRANIFIKELKTPYLDGEITVRIGHEIQTKQVKQDQKVKELSFDMPSGNSIDYVNINLDLATLEINKEKVVFKIDDSKVVTEVVEEQGHKVYIADNGVIRIKAAPTFAANLFSLEYNGQQWLDSSFPELKPKSWWNPWQGGLFSRPDSMSVLSVNKEEISADFVEINDKLNNTWSGLKVTVKVNNHDKFKGLTYHQYFLMLPGVPVVCQLAELEQNTGTYLDIGWIGSGYFKADEDINSSFLKYQNSLGEWVKIKAGTGAFDGYPFSTTSIESKKGKSLIQFISDIKLKGQSISLNKEVIFLNDNERIHAENNTTVRTIPNFILMTEERVHDLALKDLLNIRF